MDKHSSLHLPLHVKNFKGKDEAVIITRMPNGQFLANFIDASFNLLPKIKNVPAKDFSKFLSSPDCQNLKATVFNFNDLNYGYLEFRQMVYEEFRKRKSPVYLIHPTSFAVTPILNAVNVKSKPCEIVLYMAAINGMVSIAELKRKADGYSYIANRDIIYLNRSISDLTDEILATCDPQYVILFDPQNCGLLTSLKSRVVPSKNVISIDLKDTCDQLPQVVKIMFSDSGYNKVIPFCFDKLAVTNESPLADPKNAVITVDGPEELPLEKVKIVPKSKKPYYVAFYDDKSGSYKAAGKAEPIKENGHHGIKLALVIDHNSLPFLYQEPYIIPEIQTLPKKLSAKADLDLPVICFYDNSSVICVRDENGYNFLKSWNGMVGNDLFLSFEKEKPSMITDMNMIKDKDPFTVYDLIKVLSLPPDAIKRDPKWGFKEIINDDPENPVLLQFETYLGSRKSSTLVFLLALLLKQHKKAIKSETGKKPTQFGFKLFNDFCAEECARINKGLEAACKLLEINFVNVDNI